MHCYFGKLCQEYKSKAPALERYDVNRIAREYFCFWYQYKDFLLLMHKSGLDDMLYYEISRVSVEIVQKRIGDADYRNVKGIEFFADYSTGGFILLLQRWIRQEMRGTPEQYAEDVSEALLKFSSHYNSAKF